MTASATCKPVAIRKCITVAHNTIEQFCAAPKQPILGGSLHVQDGFSAKKKPTRVFKQDVSVSRALSQHIKGALINGREMFRAISCGIADKDAQAAGREYRQLKEYVQVHWCRMTPAARQVFRAYERQVMNARADGKTGLNPEQFLAFSREATKERFGQAQGYKDASIGAALSKLAYGRARISGQGLYNALGGVLDKDGEVFGREFDDVAQFADHNWHRMTPGARSVFTIYEREAHRARREGRTTVKRAADVTRIAAEMQQAMALAGLAANAHHKVVRG